MKEKRERYGERQKYNLAANKETKQNKKENHNTIFILSEWQDTAQASQTFLFFSPEYCLTFI